MWYLCTSMAFMAANTYNNIFKHIIAVITPNM